MIFTIDLKGILYESQKIIVSLAVALMLCTGIAGALSAVAAEYEASDAYSYFYCSSNVYDGYVYLRNNSGVTRWGSVSMIAYDTGGNVIGSDGYDNSLGQITIVDKRTTFSKNIGKIDCSGCLFYGNNPQGTPLSYYSKTLYN